jgi:putative ABC transport system substrate-binding protein
MRRREFIGIAGGAAAWPLAARAQQKSMPVIGYLWTASAEAAEPNVVGLRQGLAQAGYVEGKNVTIEYRMADGKYDRLPGLAADLVARNVDLILAISGPAALAAKAATATIPIVFLSGDDPVAAGLVTSLARPGGNVTGISFLLVELHPKRLQLLIELVPRAKVIAFLLNPNNRQTERLIHVMQEAAQTNAIQLPILKAATEDEIDAAFAHLADLHADAVLVGSDPFFASRVAQFATLAAHYVTPAIYQFPELVTSGGLMACGPSLVAVNQDVGVYAAKILNGAKPSDLPVQQPTKFELVINLKTAKALGLTVPQSLLQRANEVIE